MMPKLNQVPRLYSPNWFLGTYFVEAQLGTTALFHTVRCADAIISSHFDSLCLFNRHAIDPDEANQAASSFVDIYRTCCLSFFVESHVILIHPFSSFFIPLRIRGVGLEPPIQQWPRYFSLQNDLTQSTKWAAWKFLYKVPGLGQAFSLQNKC